MIERIQTSLKVSRTAAGDALVGFAFLFLTIAGHVMVETARDTLFLTDLGAATLPKAYLAIALLALGVTWLSRKAALVLPRRRVLASTSLLGAAVTALFWWFTAEPRPGVVFALYVWAGLLATAVTVQFWVVLSDRMAPRSAKRAFAFVAMGGLLGGVGGAIAAGFLVGTFPARGLLLAGAILFAVAAYVPELLSRLPDGALTAIRRQMRRRPTRDAVRDRYVRSLLALALLTAMATTGIDYLFKSMAQAVVPTESLAGFFARFYAVVNLLALLLQLLATRPLLQLFGPGGTLAALPSIGVVGAAITGLAAGLVPVALLKGADGVLRHSLHRTSTEILFVPLPGGVRDPARALSGSLGHRGGQALGSLLILGALSLALDATQVAIALSVLCLLWVFGVRRVRNQYGARLSRRSGHDARRSAPPR